MAQVHCGIHSVFAVVLSRIERLHCLLFSVSAIWFLVAFFLRNSCCSGQAEAGILTEIGRLQQAPARIVRRLLQVHFG